MQEVRALGELLVTAPDDVLQRDAGDVHLADFVVEFDELAPGRVPPVRS